MESEEVLEALKAKQTLGGEYARYWSRGWACFLDGFVVFAACALLGILPLMLVVNWLYKALMESSPKQATLGKLALGLHVTNVGGGRITFGQATKRHWGKMIFLARIWVYAFIAYALRMIPSMKELGTRVILEQPWWHDRFAGAVVVKGGAGGAALPLKTRATLGAGIVLAYFGVLGLEAFRLSAKMPRAVPPPTETAGETRPSTPSTVPAAPAPRADAEAARGTAQSEAPAVPAAPAAATVAGGIAKPAPQAPPAAPAAPAPAQAAAAAPPPPPAAPAPKAEAPPAPPAPAPEPARPAPPPPIDYDGILKACESEVGFFCDPESTNKPALLRCLRRNQAGLMPKCAKRLKALAN